jgi:hypothetical protein
MGKSREEMQDIALYHMEKANRRTRNEAKTEESLEEAVNRLDKWDSMTPGERLKSLSWGDWLDGLQQALIKDRTWSQKNYTFVTAKYQDELMKMHSEGTSYREVSQFIREKAVERLNW